MMTAFIYKLGVSHQIMHFVICVSCIMKKWGNDSLFLKNSFGIQIN